MLAQWRQAMSDTFVPLSVSCSDPARFSGSLSTDHVGVLKVTSLSSSAQHIDRTPALIARSEPDLWQIALSRGGGIRLDHDGRQVRLKPGDFVAYETARPFRRSFDGSWAATVFSLPRAAVALTESESRALTARGITGRAGAGGLVSWLPRDLADHATAMTLTHPDRVVDDITDLVLTLLRDCLAVTAPSSTGRVALLAAVKAYIRALRLRHCARDLRDARLARVPVAALAARSGFGDVRGFERAFKSAYGVTPEAYRVRGQA